MGTDIHFAVEVAELNADGTLTGEWLPLPGPEVECWVCHGKTEFVHRAGPQKGQLLPCSWCTQDGSNIEDPDDRAYYESRYVEPGIIRDRWYSNRNYVVFAVLGDVRNGSGFAGSFTHTPVIPISSNRGIPDDVLPETRAVLSDEHSPSWCMLSEVLDYDWSQTIQRGGWVGAEQYQVFKDEGSPEFWSGSIGGGGIAKVSAEGMEHGIANNRADKLHTFVTWEHPIKNDCEHFLEQMKLIAWSTGDVPVRLIFDFDS